MPDGNVKVLDFGLAKAFDAAPRPDPSNSPTLSMAATDAGVIIGHGRVHVAGTGRRQTRRQAVAITPYLLYEDVGDALKFLAKAFGFKKYGPQNRGPDGKINHAAMQLGDDVIMMGYPGPKYKNPKRLGRQRRTCT